MKPFLSIIVPVYKIKEEYLKICLNSLMLQDMDNFRVIIIDDGSPDNNGKICDEYADKDERMIVIHQKNKGVSVARNNGIKVADTEWITFVDPDDWVEFDYVSTLYEIQQLYGDSDIILFDYIQEFANRQMEKRLMKNNGVLNDEWVYNLQLAPFNFFTIKGKFYEYETNTIWNKMYKLDLIKRNNICFIPEARKGQDVIFNAECFQLTKKYYYVRKALYHYRYLQESVTNKYNPKVQYYNKIAFENYERIIRKYQLPSEYWDAYYARVVTRIYSSMRLYYFNTKNLSSKKEVEKELNEILQQYPYCDALKKVNNKKLTGSQKIFVYFLKHKQYKVLRILVNSRMILKKLKGEKLKT